MHGETEEIKLENWKIDYVFLDESMQFSAPVIDGFVGGRRVKKDILLWFDLEKGVAMTKDQIFKIGEPNVQWMGMFLAAGNSPEDLEIKDTTH